MSSKWLYTLPAILILLRLLKSRPRPSRETIVKPEDERVLLLGASSGVGRDLALAYAKRGARICLFARRAEELERVRVECMAVYGQHSAQAFSGSDAEGRILVSVGDVTNESALIEVRDTIVAQPDWKGLDTVHILAGVPSTSTLLDLAGVTLAPVQQGQTSNVRNSNKRFDIVPLDNSTRRSGPASARGPPDEEGLARLAKEARACAEVNYVGTVLALGCFVPLLASTSISPALHHLSSVAATIPAPCRAIYSATKAAGLMAMESCRIECEGSGVRFFSLLPGTIANDFRLKTATSGTGGRDETRLNIKHSWDKLLLAPEKVVDTILYHLALPPNPAPLIPYPPFNWFRSLDQPPCATFYLPFMYRAARWMGDTPLGWGYVEPNARKKYGLPN